MTDETLNIAAGVGCVPGAHGEMRGVAHTATPWRQSTVSNRSIVADRDDGMPALCIAETRTHRRCLPGECSANAALIVRAVNAHADLVAALREARVYVADEIRELLMSFCVLDDGGDPIVETLSAEDAPFVEKARGMLARIDAALARAEKP